LTTPVLVGGYDNPIRYPISTTFNATDAQNWCGGYGVVGFNGGLL